MKRKNLFLSILLLAFGLTLKAQENGVLSMEEAISLALKNNQSLKIQQRRVDIATNDMFPGNAGLVPTVSFLGNASYQSNDTDALVARIS